MDKKEILKIKNQFDSGHWPQFLENIQISGLRGWASKSINFNFPITAIVGENGSGKSTLLQAAACAYENKIQSSKYYPSTFFVNTPWDSVSEVSLAYRVKTGQTISNFKISKPSKRWSFPKRRPTKRPTRSVYIFDISRTLPLDATVGYAKIAKQAVSEISSEFIDDEYREHLSHIMSRKYDTARFAKSDADENRDVGLLERTFGEMSQFHQGAGEATTLNLIHAVQSMPDHSLMIIDEVEASLHPRAQRRLMRFLLSLIRQKRIQLIMSTHSPYVLSELPREARVLLIPGPRGPNVIYRVSTEFAMSSIDESVQPEVYIFVEDREAAVFLREILASDVQTASILERIAIKPVGPANVVQILGKLGHQDQLHFKSLGILDADVESTPDSHCLKLPGSDAPERVVYSALQAINWGGLTERFGFGAGTLHQTLNDAMLSPDHHDWNSLVGDRVRKSEISVWETMCAEWCRNCLNGEDREKLSEQISGLLNAG